MPAIEVSCPYCGKESVIEMKPHEPMKGGMSEIFESMLSGMGVKKYAFAGEERCAQCGNIIDVVVSVANRRKKEGTPP